MKRNNKKTSVASRSAKSAFSRISPKLDGNANGNRPLSVSRKYKRNVCGADVAIVPSVMTVVSWTIPTPKHRQQST